MLRNAVAVFLAMAPVFAAHGSVVFRVGSPSSPQHARHDHDIATVENSSWFLEYSINSLNFATNNGSQLAVPVTSLDNYRDFDADGYGDIDERVAPGDPRSFQQATVIGFAGGSDVVSVMGMSGRFRGAVQCEVGTYSPPPDELRRGSARPGYVGESCDFTRLLLRDDPVFGTVVLAAVDYRFHLTIPQANSGWGEVSYTLTPGADPSEYFIDWSVSRLPGMAPAVIDLSDQIVGFSVLVPSPGTATALALGGLFAVRRRRRC